MLERSERGRPGFGDYLRVMRRGPRFWWCLSASVLAFTRLSVVESATSALVALGVGALVVVAWFTLWRKLAARLPRLATEGRPELLDEIARDKPLHPSEPSSNVHRIES